MTAARECRKSRNPNDPNRVAQMYRIARRLQTQKKAQNQLGSCNATCGRKWNGRPWFPDAPVASSNPAAIALMADLPLWQKNQRFASGAGPGAPAFMQLAAEGVLKLAQRKAFSSTTFVLLAASFRRARRISSSLGRKPCARAGLTGYPSDV
jgi:hypothetical protein